MPRMASARSAGPRNVALVAACTAFLWSLNGRADDRLITAPEAPVRSAPFDVAPEVAHLHAGDRVHADDQPQGQWRRIVLPGGRYGFVREADTQAAPNSAPASGASPQSSPAPPAEPSIAVQHAEPEAPPTGPSLLGVMFELLPVGTLSATTSAGSSASADSVFAVAVAPFIDGALSPYVALGFSPQMVFRVKSDGDENESAKELDLRARLTGRIPLSPRVRVFGRFSPAFSIVFLPSPSGTTSNQSPPDPKGFLMDFSVGTEVAVLPNLFIVTDLGYQAGFQSSSDGDLHTNYLHLGAGFAIGL